MWFVGLLVLCCVLVGCLWLLCWLDDGRGFVVWQQLKTIAAPPFSKFRFSKEKGKSKKSARACACLASTSTGLNFIIRHYLPLPVYHAFCSMWSLGLLTVWSSISKSKIAKFRSQLTRLLHVWSRLTIDLVPNCSAQTTQAWETSTNAARSCPLKFIFFLPHTSIPDPHRFDGLKYYHPSIYKLKKL